MSDIGGGDNNLGLRKALGQHLRGKNNVCVQLLRIGCRATGLRAAAQSSAALVMAGLLMGTNVSAVAALRTSSRAMPTSFLSRISSRRTSKSVISATKNAVPR